MENQQLTQTRLYSDYRPLCGVALPFKERQKYMHSFDLEKPVMAVGYEDYLEPVMRLIRAAGANYGEAHMTVDENVVAGGMSQRRPGPRVDGCFTCRDWSHTPGPAWLHYCNHLAGERIARMAVIVAASVAGCRAWRGTFEGQPSESGDLSHIAGQLDEGEVLTPNVGYLLAPDCVHESMIFREPTQRTFLRIALPVRAGDGWRIAN